MTLLFTEEHWRNCQFSIARIYGSIIINKDHYSVVNRDGITLAELSDPKSRHYVGDDSNAIEPGEPADLILTKAIPAYKKLGRDAFIELLKQGADLASINERAGL